MRRWSRSTATRAWPRKRKARSGTNRASFLFEDETALEHALKIGRFESTAVGGRSLLDEVLPRYDALTTESLRETAARLFAPERWNVVWSLPEDSSVRRPTVEAGGAV